jgi:hypothetical protein
MNDTNQKLKEEVDSFKTHFTRYDRGNLKLSDDKDRIKGNIRSQVLYDLNFLMKERIIDSKYISFLSAWLFKLQ